MPRPRARPCQENDVPFHQQTRRDWKGCEVSDRRNGTRRNLARSRLLTFPRPLNRKGHEYPCSYTSLLSWVRFEVKMRGWIGVRHNVQSRSAATNSCLKASTDRVRSAGSFAMQRCRMDSVILPESYPSQD